MLRLLKQVAHSQAKGNILKRNFLTWDFTNTDHSELDTMDNPGSNLIPNQHKQARLENLHEVTRSVPDVRTKMQI